MAFHLKTRSFKAGQTGRIIEPPGLNPAFSLADGTRNDNRKSADCQPPIQSSVTGRYPPALAGAFEFFFRRLDVPLERFFGKPSSFAPTRFAQANQSPLNSATFSG